MDNPNNMDLGYDPDIADAMGFAAFGDQKKRKFNNDLNVVDGQEVKPRFQVKEPAPSSTGANMTELGPGKRSLGADEEVSPSHEVTSDPAAAAAAAAVAADKSAESAGNIDSKGDQQSAPTEPKPKKPKKKQDVVPTGLAQFLARGQLLQETRDQALQQARDLNPAHQEESPETAAPVDTPPQPSLPANPPMMEMASGTGVSGEPDLHALRRGVRNENGDLAFYSPSFVEDPWSKPSGDQN